MSIQLKTINDDPCLTCEIVACNEAHPDCSYQNGLERRTVPVDMTLIPNAVPYLVRLQRQRWASNKKLRRDRSVEVS